MRKEIESDKQLNKLLSDWKKIKTEEKILLEKKQNKKNEIEETLINLTNGIETIDQKFKIPTLNLWFRFNKFPDYPLLEGQDRGYHIKLIIAPFTKRG